MNDVNISSGILFGNVSRTIGTFLKPVLALRIRAEAPEWTQWRFALIAVLEDIYGVLHDVRKYVQRK